MDDHGALADPFGDADMGVNALSILIGVSMEKLPLNSIFQPILLTLNAANCHALRFETHEIRCRGNGGRAQQGGNFSDCH
jgi:hypothetical protein